MVLSDLYYFVIDSLLELIALTMDEIGVPVQYGILIWVIQAIVFVAQFTKKSSDDHK